MIVTVMKKEILGNVLSFKFAVVSFLLAVLVSASLYIMYNDFALRVDNYEILRPVENKKIAVIPPAPMSIFVKGLDEAMGKSFRIQFGGQIEPGKTQHSVNPIFLLFTTPDMLYIVKVILSLCALLFSFDMISGEKASRTLSLSLSNATSRSSLLFGKWIGGFVSFIVPFSIMICAGVFVLYISPLVELKPDDWTKIGLFFLGTVLYAGFFYSLGLFISTATTRPSTSLVVSLLAWTLVVFIVPNLGNTVARQLRPVQSIRQFEMKRGQIWVKEIFTLIQAQRKEPGSVTREEAFERINTENDMVRNDYSARFKGLTDLAKNITRISPAAAFTYFATDMAGTGVSEENRLKQAVIRYKDSVWDYSIDAEEVMPDDVPRFTYTRRTAGEIMADEGFLNLAVLALLTVAAFAGAYVSFLKYDVR